MSKQFIPQSAIQTKQQVVVEINGLIVAALGDKYNVIPFEVDDVTDEQCQAFVDKLFLIFKFNTKRTPTDCYNALKHTFPAVKARITIVSEL